MGWFQLEFVEFAAEAAGLSPPESFVVEASAILRSCPPYTCPAQREVFTPLLCILQRLNSLTRSNLVGYEINGPTFLTVILKPGALRLTRAWEVELLGGVS